MEEKVFVEEEKETYLGCRSAQKQLGLEETVWRIGNTWESDTLGWALIPT